MGLGPVILLGIAAGILAPKSSGGEVIVNVRRAKGRACQRTAVCFFLPGTPVGLSALDSHALLAEGATGPSLTQETCVCASIHPELSRTVS